MRAAALVFLWAISWCLFGCTAAIITLRDGTSIDGEIIEASTADPVALHVRIEGDADPQGLEVVHTQKNNATRCRSLSGLIATPCPPEDVEVVEEVESRLVLVPRGNVADIEHPGNVQAAICAPFALAGMALSGIGIYGYSGCNNWGCGLALATAGAGALIALGFGIPTVSGLERHWTSEANATPPGGATSLRAVPVVYSSSGRTFLGAGAVWTW